MPAQFGLEPFEVGGPQTMQNGYDAVLVKVGHRCSPYGSLVLSRAAMISGGGDVQVVNEALSIGAGPTVLFRYSLAVSRQRRRACPSTTDELAGRVQGLGCRPVRPIEGDRLLSSSRGKRPGAMHDSHSHSPAQRGPPTVDGLNMQSVGARFYDSGPARF